MSRPGPEEAIEIQLRRLFTAVGIDVQKVSQGVRGHFDQAAGKFVSDRGGTRQTRGQADLELWIPGRDSTLVIGKWETKSPQGLKEFEALRGRTLDEIRRNAPSRLEAWRHVQEQLLYAARCRLAGVLYGRGGIAEAYAFLETLGLATYEGQERRHPPRLVRAAGDALQRLAEVARRV